MPKLVEKATGKSWDIPSDDLAAALASGLYEAPGADVKATVVSPTTGLASDVAASQLGAVVEGTGARPESGGEFLARERGAYLEQEHGGLGSEILTGAEGAIDAATGGLYGVAARNLAPEYNEARRERAEVNPNFSTAGKIAGLVGSAVTGVGAGALAAKAGGAVAGRLGGGILATGVGMAAEGALLGATETVQEMAIAEDPVTVDRIVGSLKSNMIFGGAAGFGVGIVGKVAAKGLAKGKALVDEHVAAQAAPKSSTAVADDLAAYRSATSGDTSPYLIASDRSVLRETQRDFKRALTDLEGLKQNPGGLLKPLRREAQAIREAVAAAEDSGLAAKLAKEHADIAAELGAKVAAGEDVVLKGKALQRYTDWSGVKGPKSGLAVPPATASAFKTALEAGELVGKRQAALAKMPEILAANEALQAKIVAATAKPAESFVGKLVDRGLQGAGMSAAAGLIGGGPIGAVGMMIAPQVVGKLKDLITSRLLKAGAESGARSSAALDAFLSTAGKAAKATPPLATKVLAGVSFGEAKAAPPAAKSRVSPLMASYKARADEIQSQITVDPNGKLKMTPEARAALSGRLAGVRALEPLLADRMETVAARRIEFLASKLPKRPDIAALQLGPDRWQPSDYDVRTFARYVAAVEDPGAVEERLANGSMTPEDAEAYRSVYPERFEDFKRQIVERLPELRATLPYSRRVALSIFTGIPVDPAMHPQVLRVLQSMYADEPNTDGGMTAPKAEPQMGSITKPDPTAAQQRAS